MTLVVNRMYDLILATQVTPERPSGDSLRKTVFQAIRCPAIGEPHRPGVIEVGSEDEREALRPYFDQAGIECVVRGQLECVDAAMDSMVEHLAGQGGPPSILGAPGMTPVQVGSFYTAAAEFYRRRPWQRVPGDSILKIECDKFQGGPWYAVVMGQSGVQQGLAVYEDLASLRRMIAGDGSEEDARSMSALSLMFSEAFEISTRYLDAAEKHGWPVASPEAYPLVVRINPGSAMRAPLAWELEVLELCLRTIPEFLVTKRASASKKVTIAAGELNIHLTWVDPT